MTSNLRDRAAAAVSPVADHQPEPPDATGRYMPAELPDIEYTDPISDAERVPVHVAWARVMADVRSIGKGSTYSAPGTRFNFRGVDEILNGVAPAVRRHGVIVMPVRVEAEGRDTTTSKGSAMRETTVTVDYLVMGPAGDCLPHLGQSRGEALDTMDKGTTKAMSVALRNFYIQALSIPTRDTDPEADSALKGLERGEQPMPKATDYRDEIVDPNTSLARLRQIRAELRQHNLAAVLAVNEVGDDEALLTMCERVGKQRAGAA